MIRVADLFGYFGNRTLCVRKKSCGFVHTDFPQPSGYILSIYASKIVFQAGFTDRKAFCNLPYRNVLAKIIGKDLCCSFCNFNLRFRVEAAGFRRPDFHVEKPVDKFKRIDLQMEGRRSFRKPPEFLKYIFQFAVRFVDICFMVLLNNSDYLEKACKYGQITG